MPERSVTVDRSRAPPSMRFAPGFNAAIPFIDRHLREGRAGKAAIRAAAGEVTYGALAAGVNRCGHLLRRLGLRPGERMLMVVKDCPEFFFLFWGAIKVGVLPVPLNTILRAADYAALIADSGCAAVAFSDLFSAEVEPALQQGRDRLRVALPVDGGPGPALLQRLLDEPGDLEAIPAGEEEPCFWLYSSGSTGRPKGVIHRHRDLVATSLLFGEQVLGLREDDVIFSAAKLFFAYGLGNAMTFPLWVGATAVLLPGRPTAQNTLETIARQRPTAYFAVPTLYAMQLQALQAQPADLSSLRLCVSAGEPLPAPLFERWRSRTGLEILDGLGSTEALNTFVSNRPGDVGPGTSGRPVPGYEVRIVDEGGAEVPDGAAGRLQVRGPSIAAGYWNDPARTARAFAGGWLDTGDTYQRGADGRYRSLGRSDDMLKVGGIWCSPVEIEACLVGHPAVLEAAVTGREDADGLVKPVAWVVLRDGVPPSPALAGEIQERCRTTLAPYKFPRQVHFVPGLPKTATGKIQRYRLRALADPR